MRRKTLKQCLKEGNALLQPPDPLPTSSEELARRLGIDPSTNSNILELQSLVGKRCLELLEDIHAWLEKEYWPAAHLNGLGPSDFLLGTADLRLIRSLCSNVIDLLLLPLTIEFKERDVEDTKDLQTQLKNTARTLFRLMYPSPSPEPESSAGPSTRSNIPPTAVGQVIILKHLPYLYLSATLLAYDPTISREEHEDLRRQLMTQYLNSSFLISAIGTALQISKGSGEETDKGWRMDWPAHVPSRLGFLLAAEVRRPRGSIAIMENILGENAVLEGGRGVDTEKLDAIARAIITAAGSSPTTEWVPETLDNLLRIIAPEPGRTSPLLYVNAACYTIFRIWSLHTKDATDHLDKRLQHPLPGYKAYLKEEWTTSDPPSEMQRAINCISALAIHTPFSPEFLDYLIGRNLSILIWLRQYLLDPDACTEISSANKGSPGNDAGVDLSERIHQILLNYTRDVGLEDGVRRIFDAGDENDADEYELDMIVAEAERSDIANALAQKIADEEAEEDDSDENDEGRDARLSALLRRYQLSDDPDIYDHDDKVLTTP